MVVILMFFMQYVDAVAQCKLRDVENVLEHVMVKKIFQLKFSFKRGGEECREIAISLQELIT